MYKKVITIFITLLFVISLASYIKVISYKPGFTIHLLNKNLEPFSEASLQLNLVDPYDGIIPVYAVITPNGDAFIPINLRITNIIDNWRKFYGQDFKNHIHPYLLFFITYLDKKTNKILYDATSIKLSPREVSELISNTLRKTIILREGEDFNLKPIGYKNKASNRIDAQGTCTPLEEGYLPFVQCHESLGCPYVWIKESSDIWPSTGYGKIPVAYVNASPASWGTMSYALYLESETRFNLGIALDPFGFSEFEIGPTLFSTTLYFMESFQIPYGNSAWKKKYIY